MTTVEAQCRNQGESVDDSSAIAQSTWFDRLLSSPVLAYGLILILQLKVMWKIWEYKDLTAADTSYYYWFAHAFLHDGLFWLAWSPLYQLFCAALMSISSDPLFWCISQRLICACTLSLLVLALMRRLLAEPVAWLVTAWFALLPINFDSLYVGHIFFAIPNVIAWLAALHFPGRWGRGICLAIFLITACLVRTEVTITAAVFAAAIVSFEFWKYFERPRMIFSKRALLPYVLPCSIALTMVIGVYFRSTVQLPELMAQFAARHVLNVGQIYAFGYQQRHPEWTKSPWTDYGDLMQTRFGARNVTALEAVTSDPIAVSEHLIWNLSLVPAGLQLMLFNCISGSLNPDYISISCNPRYAVPLSWLAISLVVLGAWVLYKERIAFLLPWLRRNLWGLIAMASSCALCAILMITQRPRPSYLFPLAIALMGFYGLIIWRIAQRPLAHRLGRAALSLLPLAIIAMAPCYYVNQAQGRPLFEYYSFLKPFAEQMQNSKTSVLVPGNSFELSAYIYGNGYGPFIEYHSPDWYSMSQLNSKNIRWIFLDETALQQAQKFLESARTNGWSTAALRNTPGTRMVLFTRSQSEVAR